MGHDGASLWRWVLPSWSCPPSLRLRSPRLGINIAGDNHNMRVSPHPAHPQAAPGAVPRWERALQLRFGRPSPWGQLTPPVPSLPALLCVCYRSFPSDSTRLHLLNILYDGVGASLPALEMSPSPLTSRGCPGLRWAQPLCSCEAAENSRLVVLPELYYFYKTKTPLP